MAHVERQRFFVVSPGNAVSGGPECLHQLVHELRSLGAEAYISYYPWSETFGIPAPYAIYDVVQAAPDGRSGSSLILPEIYPALAREFPRMTAFVFWLSVNFYFERLKVGRPELDQFRRGEWQLAPGRVDHATLGTMRHLAQSHYALDVLSRLSLPAPLLGDYLGPSFADVPGAASPREDWVAFNPAKMTGAMQRIMADNPDLSWVPVTGLPSHAVRDLLSRAKLYVDFGHHPGRERIPREAAMCGACVITGRQGSAAYASDMPIPHDHRIAEGSPGWLRRFRDRADAVMTRFSDAQDRFASYRAGIAAERARFGEAVRKHLVETADA